MYFIYTVHVICVEKKLLPTFKKDMDWNLHEEKKSHIILERQVVKYFPLHSFDQLTLIKKKRHGFIGYISM